MKNKNIRANWRPLVTSGGRRDLRQNHGIYSEEQFEEIIQYERTRSDREGGQISIVFYSMNGYTGKNRELIGFLSVVKENVRLTDHIGWYPKNRIGVVLPDTTYTGAERFNAKIQKTNPNGNVPFEIRTYPKDWLDNRGNGGRGGVESLKKKKENGKDKSCGTETDTVFFARIPSWKRTVDIAGSLFGLLIFSPLFLLYALYIKVISPGPVFFKQIRVGQGRREFEFIKFRTMKPNDQVVHSHHLKDIVNSDKPMEKLDAGDPRIVPGGRFFRKTCLDEVPQFINILKGEMSLVGPRPCIPYEADEYERWHAHRFSLIPGLTGLWQVSGKNELTFHQMIRLDIKYEQNMSPRLDAKIILKTFPTVLKLTFKATLNKITNNTTEPNKGCFDSDRGCEEKASVG